MSLSQKHKGKVLVPWFNSAEWETVYQLIFSNDTVLQKKALEILHVWKIRTPNLPSGVEGTVIILEALLADCSQLTDWHISAIYSMSVQRFLNICAASSDRQGTFVKLAKENDIPDWLVSIRHDIAHGTTVPSVDMLKVCLDFCFNWVKQKYWAEHHGKIKDFIAQKQRNEKRTYSLLYSYIFVNLNLYKGKYFKDLSEELKSVLYSVLPKKLRKLSPSLYVLRSYLLDMLYNEDSGSSELKTCVEDMMKDFVKYDVLLSVRFKSNDEGTQYIPKEFRDIWTDLLKMYLHSDLIFCLVNHLFKVTNDCLNDTKLRETAATWILEIFNGLLKVKYTKEHGQEELPKNHPELVDSLDFGSETALPLEHAKLFLDTALKDPNDFTIVYLKKVFKFICLSKQMEDKIMTVFNCLFAADTADAQHDGPMYMYEDLDFEIEEEEEENVSNGDHIGEQIVADKAMKRWRRIDPKQFEGCPLGVLPHQDRSQNPLLKLIL